MPQRHRTAHRLRFNDTDRLGHVNNAVFVVMLEQGRTEMVVEAGLPVSTSDRAVVLVRLELDLLREMAWPGEVEIETWVARIGQRSMHVHQRLLLGTEECGRARTVLCVLDRSKGRAAEIAPAWRESLGRWLIPDGGEAPANG